MRLLGLLPVILFAWQAGAQRTYFQFDTRSGDYQLGPDGSVQYTGASVMPASLGTVTVSSGTTTVNGQTIPRGMQIWTVGVTGWYDIVAGGARASTNTAANANYLGGRGVTVKTRFYLTAGDKMVVLVGAQPPCAGGAGGGSFVSRYSATAGFSTSSQHLLLLAAGGGGGYSGYTDYVGVDATVSTTGQKCKSNPATAAATLGGGGGASSLAGGSGATKGSSSNAQGYGAGGGGFLGDGGDAYTTGSALYQTTGGKSFLNGGAGGVSIYKTRSSTACDAPEAGFGGGGGYWNTGAGGGGYSGGQGCTFGGPGGGGGGSYDVKGASNAGTLYTSWDTAMFGPAPTGYASGYMSSNGIVAVSWPDTHPVFALVGENNAGNLRKIDLATKEVTTITFGSGITNVGQVAVSADASFALVPDCWNNRVQKVILSSSVTSIIAGTATASRLDGTGTNAGFRCPRAIAIHPSNAYALIADRDNNAIRKLDLTSLAVTTYAGICSGTAQCTAGNTNGLTLLASSFGSPQGIAIHPDGLSAYVADNTYCLIRKITLSPTELIQTVAGTGTCAITGLTGVGTSVGLGSMPTCRISPGGGTLLFPDRSAMKMKLLDLNTFAVSNAFFTGPFDLLDGDWMGTQTSMLVLDYAGNKVMQQTYPGGVSTVFAGSGVGSSGNGIGASATFNTPITVTVWRCGIPGYGIVTSDAVCERCPVGKYSTRGELCLACPAGTYASAIGASACTLCPTNTHPNRWFTACLANAGYYIASSGVQFPPSPFMSDASFTTSGGEIFTASSSSNYPGQMAYLAFSVLDTSAGFTTELQWNSGTASYATTGVLGAYTGTYSSIVDGGTILGEWLQLQTSLRYQLGAFSIPGDATLFARMPVSFVLAGSNDGSTWTSLQTVSGLSAWTSKLLRTFSVPHIQSWAYFRLIVTNVSSTSDGYSIIDKLRFYDAQLSTCTGTCSAGTTKFCSPDGATSYCCTPSQYFIPGVSTACTNCPANSMADLVYQERCVANAGFLAPSLYMFDGSTPTYQNLGSKTSHVVTPVGWRPTFASPGTRTGAYFDSSVNGNYYTVSNDYNTITLAFWMYLSGPYHNEPIFQFEPLCMQGTGAGTRGFNFDIVTYPAESNTGAAFLFVCYASGCASATVVAQTFPVTTWLHVVLVIPNSPSVRQQRVYVNGVLKATRTDTATQDFLSNYQRLLLAVNLLYYRYYKGYLQQLTMYNYAMTDAEVTTLYNSGTPLVYVPCPGTCATGLVKHCLPTGVAVCCPPGTFFRAELDSACQGCPAGTYSLTSGSSCTLCPAGTFRQSTSQIAGIPTFTTNGVHSSCSLNSAYLDSTQGWCAATAGTNLYYLVADAGAARLIDSVTTQGRSDYAQWVTSYDLSYSLDSATWTVFATNLAGNTDQNTKITYSMNVVARYLKFLPQGYNSHPSMRVGFSAGTSTISTILPSSCLTCPANSASNAGRTGCVANAGYYNLDASLLAYFPFRPENIYADASGGGYTLTDTNGALYKPQSEFMTGPFAGAGVALLDNNNILDSTRTGRSFQVSVGAGLDVRSLVGTGAAAGVGFTICFWYRARDGSSTPGVVNTLMPQTLMALARFNTVQASSPFEYNDRVSYYRDSTFSSSMFWEVYPSTGHPTYFSSGNYARYTRNWIHQCVAFAGRARLSYYDCDSPTCSASGGIFFNDWPQLVLPYVYLGQSGTDKSFYGWMADVRLYKKALTPAEVFAVRSYSGATAFSVNGDPALLAYYPFSSSASLYQDASGNGYTLQDANTGGGYSPSYGGGTGTTSPSPGLGSAYFANSAGTAVTTATGSLIRGFRVSVGTGWSLSSTIGTAASPGPGFTWCYWLRGVDSAAVQYPFVFTIGNVFTSVNVAGFYGFYDGKNSGNAQGGSGTNYFYNGNPLGAGGVGMDGVYTTGWVHMCFTWQGKTFKAYRNCGSSACTPTASTTLSQEAYTGLYTQVLIGQGTYGTGWYGWLSEFRFYKKALTPAEVFAIKSYDGTSQTAVNSVNSGLLAYYPFHPNAFLVDASGVTGSLVPTGSPASIPGSMTDLQNVAYFAQTSGVAKASSAPQYFTIPSITFGSYFSVCAWYNPDNAYSGGYAGVIMLTSGVNTGDIQIRRDLTWNNLVVQLQNSATVIAAVTFAGLYQVNVWQHVCLTVTGTTGKLYYNGALQATTITLSAQKLVTTFTSSYLGGMNPYSNDLYRGQLDEVRIYSRAISQAEVTSIFNFRGDTYTPAIILPCQAGTYSDSTVTACTACSAGTYASTTGTSVCIACSAGSYMTSTGFTVCTSCPANSWSTGGTGKCTANQGFYNLDDTANLKAYYTFNPGALLQDGTGTTGSLTASASSPTAQASGPFGDNSNSAFLTGSSNQFFTLPSMTLPNAMSVCSWIWISPSITRSWNRIWDFANGAASSNILGTIYHTSNNLYFEVYGAEVTLGAATVTNGAETTSVWRHVCMTLSGASVVAFFNGSPTSSTLSNPRAASVTVSSNYIGESNWAADNPWFGAIDEFRIYHKALTSAEVTALYNFRGDTYSPMIMLACPNPCSAGTYGGCTSSGAQSCTGCPAGSFSTGTGVLTSSACVSCLAGKFFAASAGGTCTDCPAGTYSGTTGASLSSVCTLCLAGTFSTAAGATTVQTCSGCLAGTYSVTTGLSSSGACTGCPAPTYSGAVGASSSSVCTMCSAGTYSGNTGASSSLTCTACPAGTYRSAPSTSSFGCPYCAYGEYSAVAGATACQICYEGTFQDQLYQTQCVYCQPGKATYLWAQQQCDFCVFGKYASGAGTIYCSDCLAGTYASTSGHSSCLSCALGAYNDWTRQSACTACPAGSFAGSTGASICTACSAGTYGTGTESNICASCLAGTYRTGTGFTASAGCVACGTGTFSTTVGAQSSLACVGCVAGKYQPNTGVTTSGACTACGTGSYTASAGMSACTLCPGGSYNGGTGGSLASVCAACSAGAYASFQGASACSPCIAGTFLASTGGTSSGDCAQCFAGTYSGTTGAQSSGVCQTCLAGFYSTALGATVTGTCNPCSSCVPGKLRVSACSTASNVVCSDCAPIYSETRRYPSKLYTSVSQPASVTFLGQSVFREDMTLDQEGITYGSGVYEVYQSTQYSTSLYGGSQLFNRFGDEIGGIWALSQYPASGLYSQSKYILANYTGDWVVIKLPRPIVLTQFGFDTSPSFGTGSPGSWKLYGSKDGIVFEEIPAGSQTTRIQAYWPDSGMLTRYLNPLPSTHYLYYGWTVKSLVGSDSALNFGELEMYGNELIGLTYSSTSDASVCTLCTEGCPAGQYLVSACTLTANTVCQACSAGTYLQGTTCIACPVGTFSGNSGAVLSSACQACSAGTYSAGTGASACTNCWPASFNSVSQSTTCQAFGCNTAGSYSSALGLTAATCETCGAGNFRSISVGYPWFPMFLSSVNWQKDNADCPSCTDCRYMGVVNGVPAYRCDTGTVIWYWGGIWMAGEEWLLGGNGWNRGRMYGFVGAFMGRFSGGQWCSTCQSLTCAAGSFLGTVCASNQDNACALCDSGKYTSVTAAGTCTVCEAGTYSTVSGASLASSCIQCSAGTYSTALGASSSSLCIACGAGTYSVTAGAVLADTCALCVAGTYSPAVGASLASTCQPCLAGLYSTSLGATIAGTCLQCQAGRYFTGTGLQASGACTACLAGKYSTALAATIASTCQSCQAGTFLTGTGMQSGLACTACSAGYYATGTGFTLASNCVACAAGTFSTSTGANLASACLSCAAGKYSSTAGASSSLECTACSAGFYQTGTGFSSSGACIVCSTGTYSSGTGISTVCPPCTEGSFCSSPTVQAFCVDGTFCPSGSTQQTPCSAGTFRACTPSVVHFRCSSGCVTDLGAYNMAPWSNQNFPDTGARWVWNLAGAASSAPTSPDFSLSKRVFVSPCHPCLASGSVQVRFNVMADNYFWLYVNDVLVLSITSGIWTGQGSQFTTPLVAGFNTVRFVARNAGGPAGIAFALYCTRQDTSNTILIGRSDNTWCLGESCAQPESPGVFEPTGGYTVSSSVAIGGSCGACSAGTFSTGAVSVCSTCVPGTYLTIDGGQTCSACLAGTFSTASAASQISTCQSCLAGTYQTGTGMQSNLACTVCSAGNYATGTGFTLASNCLACAAGTYGLTAGLTLCASCLPGTYSVSLGASMASTCVSCSVGTYSVTTGAQVASTCQACSAGSYSTAIGATIASACQSCSAGTYFTGTGLQASASCTTCLAGLYSTSSGATIASTCQLCSAGTFSTSTGLQDSASCTACSTGVYSTSSGAITSSTCQSCLAGTFQSGTGLPTIGACTSCSAGLFSLTGASSCTNCPPGTFASTPGSTGCAGCNPGFYSTAFGLTTVNACIACDAGTFSQTTGASSSTTCTPCFTGKYGGTGVTICTDCASGTFASSTGFSACAACSAGTYLTGLGASFSNQCINCLSGTFSTASGAPSSSTCVACQSGTYTTLQGGTICTDCPSSSTTNTTGKSQRGDCLCNAGFVGDLSILSQSCSTCPGNSYCVGLSQTACPSNTRSLAQSSLPVHCRCVAGFRCSYRRNAGLNIRFNLGYASFLGQSESVKSKLAAAGDVPVSSVALVSSASVV